MKSSPTPSASEAAAKIRLDRDISFYAHRHLQFGWWSLLFYLALGIVLEVFHGFKIGWYLDVSNATRRLMWTLGHAHGTLLALINLGFAVTVALLPNFRAKWRPLVSGLLLAATLLLPGGFLLGGLVIHSGDPGFGILLVPLGAVFLLASVFLIARSTKMRSGSNEPSGKPKAAR